MSKLVVQQDGALIKFSGNLDEEAQIPQLNVPAGSTVRLDLGQIKSVNSVGIRTWLSWITPLSQNLKFQFENVPHAAVLQINMIEGFLPKTSEVHSFFVPIYSESEDEEDSILLTVGKDIIKTPQGPKLQMDLAATKGGDWEFDIVEKTYFKFLNS